VKRPQHQPKTSGIGSVWDEAVLFERHNPQGNILLSKENPVKFSPRAVTLLKADFEVCLRL
jgi:hypothetical protein